MLLAHPLDTNKPQRFLGATAMRIHNLLNIICFLAVTISVTGVLVVSAAADAPRKVDVPTKSSKNAFLTLDQLRDGITTWYNRIWALEAEYIELTEAPENTDSKIQPKGASTSPSKAKNVSKRNL